MKRLYILFFYILFLGCSNLKYNLRYFQFNYEIEINPTDGKKMELWIPVPQSNEVQTISNLKYDMAGLNYELKMS